MNFLILIGVVALGYGVFRLIVGDRFVKGVAIEVRATYHTIRLEDKIGLSDGCQFYTEAFWWVNDTTLYSGDKIKVFGEEDGRVVAEVVNARFAKRGLVFKAPYWLIYTGRQIPEDNSERRKADQHKWIKE
ncbi:MAG: hypothetical protein JKY59_00075 [Emcibacter sp.]|nr:hypothetical protein [Emcibacter sp.]